MKPVRNFQPGDEVCVSYSGYCVLATILEPADRNGWCMIQQDSEYEDWPAEDRPQYLALIEYVSYPDAERKPGPFERMSPS